MKYKKSRCAHKISRQTVLSILVIFLNSAHIAVGFSFFVLSAQSSLSATLYQDSFSGTADTTLDRRAPDTRLAGDGAWSTDGFSLDGAGALKGTTAQATLPLYGKIHKGDIITITAKTSYLGGNGANWLGIGFTPVNAKIVKIPMLYSWALIWGENSTNPGSVSSFISGTGSTQSGTVTNFNPAATNTLTLELDTGTGIFAYQVNGQDVVVRSDIPMDEMHQFDQVVLFNNGGQLTRIDDMTVEVLSPTHGVIYHDEFLGNASSPLSGSLPDQVARGFSSWKSYGFEILSSGDRIGTSNSYASATLPIGDCYQAGSKVRIRAELATVGASGENWVAVGLSDQDTQPNAALSRLHAWALLRGSGSANAGQVVAFSDSTAGRLEVNAGVDTQATHTMEVTYDSSTGEQTVLIDGSNLVSRTVSLSNPASLNHVILYCNNSTQSEITSFEVEVQPAGNSFTSSTIYRVADYGAVGDGSTDDGPAICNAIAAIKTAGGPASLEFESGKTYCITSGVTISSYEWSMDLNGMSDLEIDGNGATLQPAAPVNVFRVVNSTNVTVRDLTIDYDPLPFVVGEIINVNQAGYYFDLDILDSYEMTPLDPAGDPDADYSDIWDFGIPLDTIGRHHVYIDSVQPLPGSSDPRKVRVYVGAATPSLRLDILARSTITNFWLPYRGVGHGDGLAAHFGNSSDIKLENINIYSVPDFVFSVKGNEGPITFNSVHTIPKPGREQAMCSWRDVYHCQYNRGPIHFKNCTGSRSHDDTIALASPHIIVQEELTASSEFKVNTQSVPIRTGDHLIALDTYNGVDLGDFTVTAVTDTATATVKEVELDGNLDLTGTSATNIRFVNEDSANEYSRVEQCVFQGTARLRSKLTFDSNFFNGKINIKNNISTEGGPLPHDQYYVDSDFYVELGTALEIDAENSGTNAPTYRVENVCFDNCSVTGGVVVLEGSGVTGL